MQDPKYSDLIEFFGTVTHSGLSLYQASVQASGMAKVSDLSTNSYARQCLVAETGTFSYKPWKPWRVRRGAWRLGWSSFAQCFQKKGSAIPSLQ